MRRRRDLWVMHDDCPDFRLTVRRGVVRAIDWGPWLPTSGPLNTLVLARGRAGVTIADLTVVRDDGGLAREAVVRLLAGDRPHACDTIVAWAADVGYGRIWLGDAVVELPEPGEGVADVCCSGCAVRLTDTGPGFWAAVRSAGRFPAMCPLCAADLPQWRVRRSSTQPDRLPRAATASDAGGTRC